MVGHVRQYESFRIAGVPLVMPGEMITENAVLEFPADAVANRRSLSEALKPIFTVRRRAITLYR